MSVKMATRVNLLGAAMDCVREEIGDRLPGPHDDAQSELNDERLLIVARQYVEAHEDENPVGG